MKYFTVVFKLEDRQTATPLMEYIENNPLIHISASAWGHLLQERDKLKKEKKESQEAVKNLCELQDRIADTVNHINL